jgi:hypothetical protein
MIGSIGISHGSYMRKQGQYHLGFEGGNGGNTRNGVGGCVGARIRLGAATPIDLEVQKK